MTLVDLWQKSPEEFGGKKVQQVIAFAGGGGKLRDGNEASDEFRTLLRTIPSEVLARYAEDCLSGSFEESGYALQDVINEVGHRLGFVVAPGRYRGVSGTAGFDGLWRSPKGFSIVVEVKTTDAYRIDFKTLAGYRGDLIKAHEIEERASSVLVVVGREDTGGLEAQIRGSRHAWDVRLISVGALLRLLQVKEDTEDPRIHQQIADVLVPNEFTRLDSIINLVFATVADLRQDEGGGPAPEGPALQKSEGVSKPELGFRESSISRIQMSLGKTVVKRSRALYGTPDGKVLIVCALSKEYRKAGRESYWFGFHDYQEEALKHVDDAYVAFCCGSAQNIVLIPFRDFTKLLERSWKSEQDGRTWWHVVIEREDGRLVLRRMKGKQGIDLSRFVLPEKA